MLKRVLIVWLIANFLIVGAVSWLAGGWYLGWDPLTGILAELGLIMLPNLFLSVLVLKHLWLDPIDSIREALDGPGTAGAPLSLVSSLLL